ncbi:MAG: putative Tic20 family protein [Maribacter sp.]|jgi:uncharacterized Tic20 family protein
MDTSENHLSVPFEEHAISQDDKQWGMLAHLGTFLGAIVPFGNIIAPLVMMSMYQEKSEFVVKHAKEALNFQLSLLIYYTIAGMSIFFLIGFLLLPLVFVFAIIYTVVAGLKANEGEDYQYPFTIRFIK